MKEISPQPRVRLSKLRDIGWTLWDPIGLLPSGSRWDDPAHRSFASEYDTYLIAAASQLRRGEQRDEVVQFLVGVETDRMGLGESAGAHARAVAVVDAILADKTLWSWPDEQGGFG